MHARPLPVFAFILLFTTNRLDAEDDRTLAPYFFVKSGSGEEEFPLKATDVRVNVAGVIADVVVRQTYTNEGKTPIEATYIFPASTRAAVYGMTMTIADRTTEAVVQERAQAQQTYQQARNEGKSASLLEQHRANVFQMNVANILPHDTVEVELRYTELLVPTDGTYEFVFPTVVGPRYTGHSPSSEPSGSTRWASTAHLSVGQRPTATFSLAAHIAAGVPLHNVYSSSHTITVMSPSPSEADIRLDSTELYGADRDFILQYNLRGEAIKTGLLLFDDGHEKFFLYMAQPPKRVKPHLLPGREYIFIVDVSGSMKGFPLDVTKELMTNLLDGLKPTDKFNVLFFSGGSSLLSEEPLAATPGNIFKARVMMSSQTGRGGTQLLPALRKVLDMPQENNYARTIVVVTDGYITVEADAFDLIRTSVKNANVFAFGIGSSVNRLLIEGMARAGNGEPFIITNTNEARDKARRFQEYIAAPLLTKIRLDFDGLATRDVVPLAPSDLFAQRPVIVFGKWYGEPRGTVQLRGMNGGGVFLSRIDVANVQPDNRNAALKYLWARERIASLGDFTTLRPGDDRSKDITSIGLRYNLLTQYTSFVAVDKEIRNPEGEVLAVSQPLPLPRGVPATALGGGESSGVQSKRGTLPQLQGSVAPQPQGNVAPQPQGSVTPQSSGRSGTTFIPPSGSTSPAGGSEMDEANPLEPSMAPSRWYRGLLYNVTLAMHTRTGTTGFDALAANGTATGIGWSVALSSEYLLGDVRKAVSSIIFNIGYAFLPGTLSRTVETSLHTTSEAGTAPATYEQDIRFSTLKAEVLYKHPIGRTRLAIAAGPSFGVTLSGTQTERLTLLDGVTRFSDNGEGLLYENDNRTVTKSGDIPGLRSFMLSLKGGVMYEWRLGRILFVPHIFFEYPLTPLSGKGLWKVSSVQFGAWLQW